MVKNMSKFPQFRDFDGNDAPAGARSLVQATEQQFGFVPSPVARAALSPALLAHLLAGFAAFDRSSLSPIEREVVALSVAHDNECHYCMALHSALLARSGEHGALVESLRSGRPLDDERLEALRALARALLAGRGRAPSECWQAFERAGYGEEQALDVLLGVGVYALSTMCNVMVRAELDPPFVPFRWTKPGQGNDSAST